MKSKICFFFYSLLRITYLKFLLLPSLCCCIWAWWGERWWGGAKWCELCDWGTWCPPWCCGWRELSALGGETGSAFILTDEDGGGLPFPPPPSPWDPGGGVPPDTESWGNLKIQNR